MQVPYDSKTLGDVREIIETFRVSAVKERNRYNKLKRDEMAFQPAALSGIAGGAGWISACYMYYIFYEVADQMTKLSNLLTEKIQPVESNLRLQEYAQKEAQMETLIKSEFPTLYQKGKDANMAVPELVVFVLGQVLEPESKGKHPAELAADKKK